MKLVFELKFLFDYKKCKAENTGFYMIRNRILFIHIYLSAVTKAIKAKKLLKLFLLKYCFT